jgi:hypothetical protein
MSKFKNQALVDRLLDQIAKEGVDSLNDQERKFLDNPDEPLEIPSDVFFGQAHIEAIKDILPEREVHPEDAHDIAKEDMEQYAMRMYLQNMYGRKLSYTQNRVIHEGKICTEYKFSSNKEKHIMTLYEMENATGKLYLNERVFYMFRKEFGRLGLDQNKYFIPFEIWLSHIAIDVHLTSLISRSKS